MFIIKPTERAQELAALACFPAERFIRNEKPLNIWNFSGDLSTVEVKQFIIHYREKIMPIIDERAASQGLYIEGETLTFSPDTVWIRDGMLRNNMESTILICLVVPTPFWAQTATASPVDSSAGRTLVPELQKVTNMTVEKGGPRKTPIDWEEELYVGASAAVKERKGRKPTPVILDHGCVLQIDPHEELYANPKAAGVCHAVPRIN
ncbi:hypothetical protein S40293_11523 [Stachybotrys chartarum IBT 40293]|nr:hypothetical protein S40293_11523 [Stachybotrys chartarum IBT 40293]